MMSLFQNPGEKLGKAVQLLRDPGVVPLNQAIELEESVPSTTQSQLVFGICALVVAGLLWAIFSRLDIVTNATGKVMPVGDLVAVQHPEGGVVHAILVAEGEYVRKGQALLKIAALDSDGRLGQVEAKRAGLILAMEGERAIIENRQPAFAKLVPGFERQKAEQFSLFTARMHSIATQRTVLNAQIEQRQSEVARLKSQLTILSEDYEASQAELKLREDLFARKLTTRDRLYGAQRDATDRRKQFFDTRDQIGRAQGELAEYQRRLAEFESKTLADSQAAVAQHTAEISELDQSLRNEKGRTDRLVVRSPVDGVVSGLSVKAVNALVKPGDNLMDIVPTNDPLVVIAEVLPQDIGEVKVGQRADVRVSAFDYATYGTLEGKIDRISATTFSDEEGRRFYKIRVRLNRDYFGNSPRYARVLPGMDVAVDVKTGSRSLFAYLVKPVSNAWATALRER